MIELRQGKLCARIALVIANTANVYLKSTDMVDIQTRLTKMETLYAERKDFTTIIATQSKR